MRRRIVLAVALAIAASCNNASTPPPPPPVDGGFPDAGTVDAGAADARTPGDAAGAPDADVDAGDADAASDAGPADAGTADATTDAGNPCVVCAGGLSCDPASRTCYQPCSPSCPTGYACETAPSPSRCAPQLVACDGGACAVGQACLAGACACLPTLFLGDGGVAADSCLTYGRQCQLDRTCKLPGELEWCTPLGGCLVGTDCVPAIGPGNPSFRCLRRCAGPADCPHPRTTCVISPPSWAPELGNHCGFDRCSNFFQTCTGGNCLPTVEPAFESGPTTYYYAIGVCLRPGTAASGADCRPDGTLLASGEVCPLGEFCRSIDGAGGVCGAVCNYGSAVTPACAVTDKCVNATGVDFGSPPVNQLGVCVATCGPFGPPDGGPDCPVNASGRIFGCQPERFVAVDSLCTPIAPDAGRENGPCTVDRSRGDSPCRSRMFCTGWYSLGANGIGTGICERYCDRRPCGDAGTCSPSCGAGGTCSVLTTAAPNVLGRCAGSDAGAAD